MRKFKFEIDGLTKGQRYCKNHPDRIKQRNRENKEYHHLYMRQYQKLPEVKLKINKYMKEYMKGWRKTPKGKEREKRHNHRINAKRREFGFVPLNEPFLGSVAHHIDKECVIYIPEQLHKSIPHNIHTGKGMFEINDKVFEWLTTPRPLSSRGQFSKF